ncbi:hypothetical protein L211DRAFT_847353 [Terfezia boudieri ATCC MYA-4762]|uniref:Uncharacterized protein n=1 Tax=Terfezia boudieri ATCC MYA-4762 TaxID=1051890 RepID=A0A3N4LTH7_9PEZI|nr:hypothetical protein L211DRAFT_847353 [Terfezia boudieri ATCC MYA-4762]
MTTFARGIKVKDLIKFNRMLADLESFDALVKYCLLAQNLPLYYRGCGPHLFSSKVDARTAEIELGKFKWEAYTAKKDTMTVAVFRTTIECLIKRVGKTIQFE